MPHDTPADPRPLTGEPLSIDLLNTRWIDAAGYHDLLDGIDGLAIWLGSPFVRHALGDMTGPADEDTLGRVLQARTALDGLVRAVSSFGDTPQAVETGPLFVDGTLRTPRPVPVLGDDVLQAVNAVLGHGRIHRSLRPDGPASDVRVDQPSWGPAWTAVEDFLGLLADRPERIRPCANPECVLHFYDVSKNGTRRWCSMAGCGNRAKAMRHYRRTGRG